MTVSALPAPTASLVYSPGSAFYIHFLATWSAPVYRNGWDWSFAYGATRALAEANATKIARGASAGLVPVPDDAKAALAAAGLCRAPNDCRETGWSVWYPAGPGGPGHFPGLDELQVDPEGAAHRVNIHGKRLESFRDLDAALAQMTAHRSSGHNTLD